MLSVAVVLTLGLVSCDANDLFLENEIVGSWSCIYEDNTVFEEEVYDFDPVGRWTYRYIYENIYVKPFNNLPTELSILSKLGL